VGLYPLAERVVLFGAPFAFLLIGNGAAHIAHFRSRRLNALCLVAVTVWFSTTQVDKLNWAYAKFQDMGGLLQEIQPMTKADDTFYIYYSALPAFTYYSARVPLHATHFVSGVRSRPDPLHYITDLRRVCGLPRVWFVFSHVYRTEELDELSWYTEYLSKMGKLITQRTFSGSSAYLFDLSEASPQCGDPTELPPIPANFQRDRAQIVWDGGFSGALQRAPQGKSEEGRSPASISNSKFSGSRTLSLPNAIGKTVETYPIAGPVEEIRVRGRSEGLTESLVLPPFPRLTSVRLEDPSLFFLDANADGEWDVGLAYPTPSGGLVEINWYFEPRLQRFSHKPVVWEIPVDP